MQNLTQQTKYVIGRSFNASVQPLVLVFHQNSVIAHLKDECECVLPVSAAATVLVQLPEVGEQLLSEAGAGQA